MKWHYESGSYKFANNRQEPRPKKNVCCAYATGRSAFEQWVMRVEAPSLSRGEL